MYPDMGSEEWPHSDATTLKQLNFQNKTQRKLWLKFVRAFAFLCEDEVERLIDQVSARTQGKYPRDMIMQAINMAPECKFTQTLSNLYNHPTKVFEGILKFEDKNIISEVLAIR